MSPRDEFLHNVRHSVRAGNRAGPPPLPQRQQLGYQGAGADALARFCSELTAAGGRPHVAADAEVAWQIIRDIIQGHGCRKAMIGRGGVVERYEIMGRLRSAGLEVTPADAMSRDALFAADIAISNVHRLIAETGTVVMATAPDEPRALSLLPPVHIALAERTQILPDLFDLFDLFSPVGGNAPPACLSLITGPSKTGDIELRLVTGVHGPGEIHVIVCG